MSATTTEAPRVPLLFDADEMTDHLASLDPAPTPDEVLDAMCRVGRNDNPHMIHMLAAHIGPRHESIAANVHHAWSAPEYPEDSQDADEWVDLLEAAGYRDDGAPTQRPQTVTLYRGCPESRLHRMAWTGDIEVARMFAHRGLRGREPGHVWQAEVDGRHLLAHITDREEDEYLVDPRAWTAPPTLDADMLAHLAELGVIPTLVPRAKAVRIE